MKSFFEGVKKHIAKLDAEHLRVQYTRLTDELKFFELIFKAMHDAVIIYDMNGEIVYRNPAGEKLPNLDIQLGKTSKTEMALTYPDNRIYEIQTIPFERGTLVYIRDTTAERERTEEELQAGATKAIKDLAAGVAHEIGNPLNAISLNLQLLERDPTDKESIEICKMQIKRLDGIIREFLSALKPSTPNLTAGSPAEPLKNCLDTMHPQFEERRISMVLDIPVALPPVALDKNQIEQVCFNLIKNALDAMKDGGVLSIELSSDDQSVTMKFSDNGSGIDETTLHHLFEPYRTTKSNGTGLGLMITKRIITNHGGSISVESKLNEGTTFTIKLPRLEKRVRQLNG